MRRKNDIILTITKTLNQNQGKCSADHVDLLSTKICLVSLGYYINQLSMGKPDYQNRVHLQRT